MKDHLVRWKEEIVYYWEATKFGFGNNLGLRYENHTYTKMAQNSNNLVPQAPTILHLHMSSPHPTPKYSQLSSCFANTGHECWVFRIQYYDILPLLSSCLAFSCYWNPGKLYQQVQEPIGGSCRGACISADKDTRILAFLGSFFAMTCLTFAIWSSTVLPRVTWAGPFLYRELPTLNVDQDEKEVEMTTRWSAED